MIRTLKAIAAEAYLRGDLTDQSTGEVLQRKYEYNPQCARSLLYEHMFFDYRITLPTVRELCQFYRVSDENDNFLRPSDIIFRGQLVYDYRTATGQVLDVVVIPA